MSTFVVLLRGVNVSGKNKLPMADLRAATAAAGFENARSYIQSGNLVVDAKNSSAKQVASRINELISDEFGLDVPVIVRTPTQWRAVADSNPHLAEGVDSRQLAVAFLNRRTRAGDAGKLDTIKLGDDRYVLSGSEIYLDLVSGAGRTKLTNAAIEKKLGVIATSRNLRTIAKIDAMLES